MTLPVRPQLDILVAPCPEAEKLEMRKGVITSILQSEREYVAILDVLQQVSPHYILQSEREYVAILGVLQQVSPHYILQSEPEYVAILSVLQQVSPHYILQSEREYVAILDVLQQVSPHYILQSEREYDAILDVLQQVSPTTNEVNLNNSYEELYLINVVLFVINTASIFGFSLFLIAGIQIDLFLAFVELFIGTCLYLFCYQSLLLQVALIFFSISVRWGCSALIYTSIKKNYSFCQYDNVNFFLI